VPFVVAGGGGYKKKIYRSSSTFHDALDKRRLPIQVENAPELLENFNDWQHGCLRIAVTPKKVRAGYVAVPNPPQNPKDQVLKLYETAPHAAAWPRDWSAINTGKLFPTGPSGSPTIAQSGTFSALANAKTPVGMASFNREPGRTLRHTSASG
jgi:hypothetical protein